MVYCGDSATPWLPTKQCVGAITSVARHQPFDPHRLTTLAAAKNVVIAASGRGSSEVATGPLPHDCTLAVDRELSHVPTGGQPTHQTGLICPGQDQN